jgi:hypothetical protein
MIQAAKKAGVYPVTLVKEPEAAALYTFMTLERALSVSHGINKSRAVKLIRTSRVTASSSATREVELLT